MRNAYSLNLKNRAYGQNPKRPVIVKYDDIAIGEFKFDILVEDNIIVELKSIKALSQIHEVQLVNYLAATGKDIGLLLNFGEQKVQVKRKVRKLKNKKE